MECKIKIFKKDMKTAARPGTMHDERLILIQHEVPSTKQMSWSRIMFLNRYILLNVVSSFTACNYYCKYYNKILNYT